MRRERESRFVAGALLGAALLACAGGGGGGALPAAAPQAPEPAPGTVTGYAWDLPAGFPPPPVPADNPMSEAKVELGRRLFFETDLSGNRSQSCAGCHRPELAFTDGRARAVGSTGEIHPRGAMSLANVAYNASYNWADPRIRTLEEQMRVPLFSTDPVEMGLFGREAEAAARLAARPVYRELFARAFPEEPEPVTLENAIRAIASFERTLISGGSAFDRFVYWGEGEGFSDAARRGMELFFSARLRCSECHGGFNLSAPSRTAERPEAAPAFHNTGLYDLDGAGAYPPDNRGAIEATGRPEDMGRFKAPTLRNVALTAPYMHDGSLATLAEAVDHYAAGGRGPGRDSPLKSPLVEGFELADGERRDLIAFLESLTDPAFATPRR